MASRLKWDRQSATAVETLREFLRHHGNWDTEARLIGPGLCEIQLERRVCCVDMWLFVRVELPGPGAKKIGEWVVETASLIGLALEPEQ